MSSLSDLLVLVAALHYVQQYLLVKMLFVKAVFYLVLFSGCSVKFRYSPRTGHPGRPGRLPRPLGHRPVPILQRRPLLSRWTKERAVPSNDLSYRDKDSIKSRLSGRQKKNPTQHRISRKKKVLQEKSKYRDFGHSFDLQAPVENGRQNPQVHFRQI